MKILSLLLVLVMTIEIKAQVFVSEKTTGHKITFVIIDNDSVTIERYYLQLKLLSSGMLSRKINSYKLVDISDNTIITNKFKIVIKNKNTLCIDNVNYLLHKEFEKFGDYYKLNSFFGHLSSVEKLNVCRNCYILLNPDKRIRRQLQKHPKKGLKILEDIDCQQEQNTFLQNLLKILNKT